MHIVDSESYSGINVRDFELGYTINVVFNN